MKWTLIPVLVIVLFLSACGGTIPVTQAPQDSSGTSAGVPTPGPVPPGGNGNYAANYALPAVTTIYTMTAVILAAPGSVSQYQVQGQSYTYDGHGSGYISGSTTGKGLLRVRIMDLDWYDPYAKVYPRAEGWSPLAHDGDTVLLKTEDTKAAALAEGDEVIFLCREDQEFVAAAAVNEIPTTQSVTREFDNCRMFEPQFRSKE